MDDEHPEWLPADWKVCVKVRTTGKKDKYYINPSDGLKFNSKPEVLRYLKNAEKDMKPEEPNKTSSKKTVAEELPPGWIKEIKITKKRGKTRKNPYYIDPVSGRHFRSLQEVSRYLETKDSVQAESKEEDEPDPTNEELDHPKSPTDVVKDQRLTDKKEDEILAVKSEGAAVENINPALTNGIGQGGEEKDFLGEDGQEEKVAPQNKRKKSKGKWMNDLPRRSSKRLARVEADPPLDMKTSSQAREADRPSDEREVNASENTDKSEISTSEDFGKQKEEATNPPVKDVSSVEEHETVGNAIELKEDEKNEKQPDSSLNDLLMDPCIEFAIKTLTGAIPIEAVNKVGGSSVVSQASPNRNLGSSSALPFGDIWSDPCFEFAVKTLTSEVPVEDASRSKISFEKPLASSGAGGCKSVRNDKFDPSMKV